MKLSEPPHILENLLDCTEQLIYNGGITATGMDLVVSVSGVSRKTIYKYFGNKEGLIVETLKRRDERWLQNFTAGTLMVEGAKERILQMFVLLDKWINSAGFRGCAFINAAGEIGDARNPVRIVAKEHKLKLLRFIESLVDDCKLREPEGLAEQLLLLLDGAISVAMVTKNRAAARQAHNIAEVLITR